MEGVGPVKASSGGCQARGRTEVDVDVDACIANLLHGVLHVPYCMVLIKYSPCMAIFLMGVLALFFLIVFSRLFVFYCVLFLVVSFLS